MSDGFEGLYSGSYEGTYVGSYIGAYEAVYSAGYEGSYEGAFLGTYSSWFEGSYGGDVYSRGFTGGYAPNPFFNYYGVYSRGYEATFVGAYSGQYEGYYEGSFVGLYSGQYDAYYSGVYGADFAGMYSTAYAGTYSLNIGDVTVETVTKYHGKPVSTITTGSSGSVELDVSSGGGSIVTSGSNQPGKSAITRIASNDTIVHLGIVDLENLTVDLKPKAVAAGEKAPGLGTSDRPFGDLFLQGNTLTLSTRSISITESGGAEYIDFGANTIIGATQVTGDRLLAFADQLKITGLTDVSLAGLNDGNILKWSVSQNKWIPGTPSTIESLQLYQLEDVDTAGLLNGYVLKWNALINKWEVGSPDVATSVDLSTSDIGDLGNVTKIPYPHSSVFQYNTIESRWKAVAPDSINFEDLTSGTLTVNTEVVYSTTRTVQVTAGEVVADSFSINTYRSAKYIITCEDYTTDNKGYWTGEIILAHDGTNAVITVFGEVEIGDQSMNPIIAADISSGNVRLKVTTTSDQQVVTSHRSVITKYT